MAISDVDKKYLGRFASRFQAQHPLLAQSLFQILGIFTMLSGHVIQARKLRSLDTTRTIKPVDLYLHIVWLAREGLKILEEYVMPMVANYGELKALSYKLRASFYHLFVLFHNEPAICLKLGPERLTSFNGLESVPKADKSKSLGHDGSTEIEDQFSRLNSVQFTDPLETTHLDAGLNPSFTQYADVNPDFLIPAKDYRPITRRCFEDAINLANHYLYGSHPIRLSLMVEYSTYIYECLHSREESRQLAKVTVAEVFNAQEGIDSEEFSDSIHLVNILGKIMTRGFDDNVS